VAGIEVANSLKPGEEPKAPLAKPGTPWTYGNVPAEVK